MTMKKYIPVAILILILILILLLVCMLLLPALVPETGREQPVPAEAGDAAAVSPRTQVSITQNASADEGLANANADTAKDSDEVIANANADTAKDSDEVIANANADSARNPDEGISDLPDNPERVFYREGFSSEPLTEEIKEKINGVSYHENDTITYDDLSLLRILYYDFEGTVQRGEMICNQTISDDLLKIFATLYDEQYQLEKIRLIDEYGGDDDLSCADNNTSCFNYRVVAGSTHLSNHAKGLAVDINPFYNPYITHPDGGTKISPEGSETYADRSNLRPHMIDENDLCYKLFTEHGFTWGGHWKSVKDYQHFEKP